MKIRLNKYFVTEILMFVVLATLLVGSVSLVTAIAGIQ